MHIEHIAMYVNDLEKARTFFMRYFGASSNEGYQNPRTDFRSYFLSFDCGARLEIMNKPLMSDTEKGLNRTGYIHIAFSLGSKSAVDELTERLKADGYELAAYTGFTFERLIKDENSYEYKLLQLLDILVDGPFVLAKRSLSAGFRGSTNQRVLNVPASLEKGEAVWEVSARWQTLNAVTE